MSEVFPEDSPEYLEQQLNEAMEILDTLNQEIEPIEAERRAIQQKEQAAREAYHAAVAAAREEKAKIDAIQFEKQSAINQLKMEMRRKQERIEALKKEQEIAKARQEREAELLLLNERWDKLTLNAHWREWAKDHQIEAGHMITKNRKVILADPMGLGKTLSAIITCDMSEAATRTASPEHPFLGEDKEVSIYNPETKEYGTEWKIINGIERPVGKRVLYFCPPSLIRNVEKEFRNWAGHRAVTYVGTLSKKEREFVFEFQLANRADFIVICNYEAWRKDKNLIDQLIKLDPDTVILDEAHNLKEMTTSAYRGIKTLLDKAQPEYVIPMTGTPILNRPQELFSLLTLVNPNKFYHINDFLYNYCEQTDDGKWKFQDGGLDRIAKQIADNFLRRTRDQAGIILPEKTIINHDLEVDEDTYPDQARVRKQMRDYATIMIDEAQGKAIAAAAMIAVFTRLRQIETWPAGIMMRDPITKEIKMQVDVEESQKVDYVISEEPDVHGNYDGLIPEIIEDERVVLFSQFKAPLQEIKRRVEKMGKRAVVLDGDTPEKLREEIRTDFDIKYTPNREDAKWDIVLCNYKVGGVGLNLTCATQMIILDEEWNPGKRDQAYDRIHRIGQEKPVTIHVIRNQKTIDDWLAGIMEQKEGVVDGFNNTMVTMAEFKDALDSGLL